MSLKPEVDQVVLNNFLKGIIWRLNKVAITSHLKVRLYINEIYSLLSFNNKNFENSKSSHFDSLLWYHNVFRPKVFVHSKSLCLKNGPNTLIYYKNQRNNSSLCVVLPNGRKGAWLSSALTAKRAARSPTITIVRLRYGLYK